MALHFVEQFISEEKYKNNVFCAPFRAGRSPVERQAGGGLCHALQPLGQVAAGQLELAAVARGALSAGRLLGPGQLVELGAPLEPAQVGRRDPAAAQVTEKPHVVAAGQRRSSLRACPGNIQSGQVTSRSYWQLIT